MSDFPLERAFDLSLPTRLVFGEGAVDRLGELARGLGARRQIILTLLLEAIA